MVVGADLEVIWEVQRQVECQTLRVVARLLLLEVVVRPLGDLVQVEEVC